MGAFDLYNKHGAPLCFAIGCRKHKKLIDAHKGVWCKVHYKEEKLIRAGIKNAKSHQEELYWRMQEASFRKDTADRMHLKRMMCLEYMMVFQELSNDGTTREPASSSC